MIFKLLVDPGRSPGTSMVHTAQVNPTLLSPSTGVQQIALAPNPVL